MKTLKLIALALCATMLYLNLTACSDDNDTIPASITGTTWTGVDLYAYSMEAKVVTSTTGVFTVYEPETDNLYYTLDFTYLFNRETGEIIVQLSDGEVTIDYYGTTLTLHKQ